MSKLICLNCGAEVNFCHNSRCIKNLHEKDSFQEGERIFCDKRGNHYCSKDCFIEEFLEHGIDGVTIKIAKKGDKE